MQFRNANMTQSADADPCLIIDPILNSLLSPFSGKYSYAANANGYQVPMHACKPISNSMFRETTNIHPCDALVGLESFGCNDLASAHDAPISPLGNMPLPYIPDELLCSLSNALFEPKPLQVQEEDLKKINSHSKRNHKVLIY